MLSGKLSVRLSGRLSGKLESHLESRSIAIALGIHTFPDSFPDTLILPYATQGNDFPQIFLDSFPDTFTSLVDPERIHYVRLGMHYRCIFGTRLDAFTDGFH